MPYIGGKIQDRGSYDGTAHISAFAPLKGAEDPSLQGFSRGPLVWAPTLDPITYQLHTIQKMEAHKTDPTRVKGAHDGGGVRKPLESHVRGQTRLLPEQEIGAHLCGNHPSGLLSFLPQSPLCELASEPYQFVDSL